MELLSFGDTGYGDELFFGALITIKLAIYGYLLALVFGILIAIVSLKGRGVRWIAWRVYSSIFTGIPSLLVIFLFYFGGAEIVRAIFSPLGLNVRLDMTPFAAGVAALAIVYAAYVAELVRGAILNVPRGQFEAGDALSIPRRHLWLRIILPQAGRLAMPGLVNIWIVLLKDTALVSLAGLNDIIAQAKIAAGSTKEPFIFFTAAALFFVVLSMLTLRVVRRLGARFERGVRSANM